MPFVRRQKVRPRITRAKTLHELKLLQDAIRKISNQHAIKMVTDQFISTLLSATLDTQVQNGGLSFATLSPAVKKQLHDEVGLEERLFSISIAEGHRRYLCLRFIFIHLPNFSAHHSGCRQH